MNSSVKHIPKDAQVIMSILKELNVTEYEPRVINQLLEFTYRTYCDVVMAVLPNKHNKHITQPHCFDLFTIDAHIKLIFTSKKKSVPFECGCRLHNVHSGRCQNICESCEKEDHRLGRCQIGVANDIGEINNITTTPRSMFCTLHSMLQSIDSFVFSFSAQVLLELARAKNIAPLPLIKSHCGLRLPPERHCLLSANYKLRASDIQPKKMTKSALERTSGKVKAPGTTVLKRQTITTAPKTQAVTIPRPVIKFSANPNPKPIISATISTTSQSSSSSVISDKDAKETDLDKDKDKEEKDGEKVPQPSVGAASATAIVAGGSSGAPKDDQETKMDVDDEPKTGESKGLKRKHDDDDDLQVVE